MNSLVVLQTDFGLKETSVAAMVGVMKTVEATLDINHATHEIPQYDTWIASYRLLQMINFWPNNTVFVSVVDPGVGSKRKAGVIQLADGKLIVTPDNGSLTHIKQHCAIQACYEIDVARHKLSGFNSEEVAIFHGRDLFGYVAAKLAAHKITLPEVGKPYAVSEIISHPLHEVQLKNNTIIGNLDINDPNFGNVWTNIPMSFLKKANIQFGDTLLVTINQQTLEMPLVKAFSDADKACDLAYHNELNYLAFATNQASFQEKYNIRCNYQAPVIIRKK